MIFIGKGITNRAITLEITTSSLMWSPWVEADFAPPETVEADFAPSDSSASSLESEL